MSLGGKWPAILKVTFNSKLYKTYIHLKVIFAFFTLQFQIFCALIFHIYCIIMCNWYTGNEIIFHMLTGDIDCGRGLVFPCASNELHLIYYFFHIKAKIYLKLNFWDQPFLPLGVCDHLCVPLYHFYLTVPFLPSTWSSVNKPTGHYINLIIKYWIVLTLLVYIYDYTICQPCFEYR